MRNAIKSELDNRFSLGRMFKDAGEWFKEIFIEAPTTVSIGDDKEYNEGDYATMLKDKDTKKEDIEQYAKLLAKPLDVEKSIVVKNTRMVDSIINNKGRGGEIKPQQIKENIENVVEQVGEDLER